MTLVAVPADSSSVAGALVYWALSGIVDQQDLYEQAEIAELGELFMPEEASLETCVLRAAENCISTKQVGRKIMIRPVAKRNRWDLVEEQVVTTLGTNGEKDRESLKYTELVRIQVERQADNSRTVSVTPSRGEETELADQIKAMVPTFKGIMTANDVSSWLLHVVRGYVHAVSLRERGGFYFVPRDQMEKWKTVMGCVRAVSDHKLFEIPAMQSEEAVEAILEAVRKEADGQMTDLETYLAGEVSTKGLNAWERTLELTQAKMERYAALLGVALPDLESKAETLQGALVAARIKKAAEK